MPATATKTKSQATAFFRVSPGVPKLTDEDKAAGILRGVRIMELGVQAFFKGADGKTWNTKITEEHTSALLGLAGNRTLPAHWTHEWHEAEAEKRGDADSVELAARCGAWKNFRKDGTGNVIADAYLRNDEHRDEIFFAAEHDPENLMASAVFNYQPTDKTAMPTSFRCVDFVPSGAATTALFSEADPNSKTMDIAELIEALKDPKVQAAVSAIIKSHKADADPEEEAPAAEMEKAADVSDADKKDEKPALMSRMDLARVRVAKAITRKIGELATTETALLAKAELAGKTGATAMLGKGGYVEQGAATEKATAYLSKIKEYEQGGKVNPSVAEARVARDFPDLYTEHRTALFAKSK